VPPTYSITDFPVKLRGAPARLRPLLPLLTYCQIVRGIGDCIPPVPRTTTQNGERRTRRRTANGTQNAETQTENVETENSRPYARYPGHRSHQRRELDADLPRLVGIYNNHVIATSTAIYTELPTTCRIGASGLNVRVVQGSSGPRRFG